MPKGGHKLDANDFYEKNKEYLLAFGDYFIRKLNDEELMDKLAEKDPEKLARIFKLVFDRLEKTEEKHSEGLLDALVEALGATEEDEQTN